MNYLNTRDPEKSFIVNSGSGDACGVIRPVRIGPNAMPTQEEVEKAVREDPNSVQIPYLVKIHIMPLRFLEFWQLIWSRKVDQANQYEFFKWKMAFDAYRESLPAYYNDYLNSFLKYLQVPATAQNSVYSVPTERRIYD